MRRIRSVHGRRGLQAPRVLALRGLGRSAEPWMESPALLDQRKRRLEYFHPARGTVAEEYGDRAGEPCKLLRGRRLCTVGGTAAGDGVRVGGGGRRLAG